MVSIIQKLNPHFSFAKWLLCSTGLMRYLHPTDEALKTLAGVPKDKSKGKHKERNHSFHVPRSLDIELETVKISQLDVVHLRYFTEYQWLVDFSLYAAFVYILSEVRNKLNSTMFMLKIRIVCLGVSLLFSVKGRG